MSGNNINPLACGEEWTTLDEETHSCKVVGEHDGHRCQCGSVQYGDLDYESAGVGLVAIVVTEADLRAAESRGYQRAIDDLRAAPTFEASDIQWWGVPGDAFVTPSDYLEALAAVKWREVDHLGIPVGGEE